MNPPAREPEPLGKVLRVEYQALIEGVDVDRAVLIFVLDDEVARKPDPLDLDPCVPCHLDVYDRQGNGNADPPVHHLVEVAVAGVVILFLVTSEVLFVEEDPVQGFNRGLWRLNSGAGLYPLSKALQGLHIVWDIQVRIFPLGNQKSGARQVDIPVWRGHQLCECALGSAGLGVFHQSLGEGVWVG